MAEKVPTKIDPETAPDPEEDDLDDLDDVLDEFQSTSISDKSKAAPASTAPTASGPGRPTTGNDATQPPEAASEEDFAKQLQSGMSSLISELDSNPEMQAEFEKMMEQLIAAGAAGTDQEAGQHLKEAAEAVPKAPATDETSKPKAAPTSSSSKKSTAGGDDFQDTIRRTMQRMQASDTGATQASTAPQSEEDMLAQMMKELTEGGGGMGGGEDFNAMLMNMMAHLTNKEILYEPMKELSDKFPEWMEKNRDGTPKEDLERYERQRKLVGEIVARFERKGYSDDNEEDREYIVERMQQMQSEGSPPSDLVGDMSAAQEALDGMESGCPTQ